MAGLTPAHLLIILVIALIVIGPGKLPEVGASIGKSFREFQKAVGPMQDAAGALTQGLTQPSQPAATTPPAQPVYAAPAAPVAQPPVQYQPVMGVVEAAPAQPAPAQPAPGSDLQADATSLPNTPKVG